MAANVSRQAIDNWAAGIRQRPRTLPFPEAWGSLTTASRTILTSLLKLGQVATLAELTEAVDLPDLAQHLEDLRLYVQPAIVPVRGGRAQEGVTLTASGLDLAQWGVMAGDH